MKKNTLQESRLAKGFALPMAIGIIALVLILGGIAYVVVKQFSHKQEVIEQKEGDHMTQKEGEAMQKENGAMAGKEGDHMTNDHMMTHYTGAVIAGTSAPLLDFNKADYDAAVKTDKLVVLYFYANWCPICKVETQSALYPAFNELTTDKVVGFRINYNDDQTDQDEKNLAEQFGIAYQHSKVFLKNGQRVLKSPESWDKSRYEQEINKYINL